MKPRRAYFGKGRKRAITRPFPRGNFSVQKIKRIIQLSALELGYLGHILLRKPHDFLYHNQNIYKRYMDHPARKPIHRSVAAGFVASTIIFLTLQYALPNLFDFITPNKAMAATNSAIWDTNADFSAAQNDGNVSISGAASAATVKLANNAALNYGDGSDGQLIVDGTTNGLTRIIKPDNSVILLGCGPSVLLPGNCIASSATPLYLDLAYPKTDNKYNFTSVLLQNGGSLTHSLMSAAKGGTEGIEIYATGSITVNAGTSIDVTGKSAMRVPTANGGKGGGGGGYAAAGGNGFINNVTYAGGSAVGSGPTDTQYMGSSGAILSAGSGPANGYGGGRVSLSGQTVVVAGNIAANGKAASGFAYGGGGSGGGIVIKSSVLTVSGTVSAAGGGGTGNGSGYVGGLDGSLGTGGRGGALNPYFGQGGAPGVGGAGGSGSYSPNNGLPGGPSAGAGGATNNPTQSAGGGGSAGRVAVYYGSFNSGLVPTTVTTLEESNAGIVKTPSASWTNWNQAWGDGTTVSGVITSPTTYTAGTYLTYTFTGQDRIDWIGTKGVDGGKADVTITPAGGSASTSTIDTYVNNPIDYCTVDVEGGDIYSDCGAYGGQLLTANPPLLNQTLYTNASLDSTKTYTMTITQNNASSGSGRRITLDKLIAYSSSGSNYVDAPGASNKVGPYGYFTKVQAYVNTGLVGGANTASSKIGLRADAGKNVFWKSIKLAGSSTVPTGTSVRVMARFAPAYGSGDFVQPESKANIDTWSTTIAAGGSGLDISSQFIYAKTVELYVQLNGGSDTPVIDMIQMDYDNLDAPALSSMSLSSASNGTFSTNGSEGSWTKDTLVNFNVPVGDVALTCTSCSTSIGRKSQIEIRPITTAFNDLGTVGIDYIQDGGTGDSDTTANGVIPMTKTTGASPVNFVTGGQYHWRARSSDAQGRVSDWTNYGAGSDVPTAVADFTIDQVAPTITSVTSTTANGMYKAGANVNITVNFSEPVTSTGNVAVGLDSGGSCSFSVANASSGSCTYTVLAGQNSGDLTTSSITGTIQDAALNTLVNFTPATTLASAKNIVIDATPPTITSVTSATANGVYKAGTNVNITVNFSEIVTSTGNVTVSLDSGGSCTFSIASSTTGSCTYAVQAGQNSADLTTSSIVGNINDAALNAMVNYTPATTLASAKNIVIDTIAPVTTSTTVPATPDGNTVLGKSYYVNAPSITLSTVEVNPGTQYFYWDTEAPQVYSGSVAMPATDGDHTLHFYAVDAANNVETTNTDGPYHLDLHGPVVSTFTAVTSHHASDGTLAVSDYHLTLNILAADTTSGVDTFQLSNDGTTFNPSVSYSSLVNNYYLWDILPQENSATPQTVYMKIRDGAGKETAVQFNVIYDNTAPGATTIAPKSANGGTALAGVGQSTNTNWYAYQNPYFGFSATDSNALPSGIKGYKYCFSTNQNCAPSTFTASAFVEPVTVGTIEGRYYLRVLAVDNMDLDSASIATFNYNYDKSAPGAAVYGLTATKTDTAVVRLTWSAQSWPNTQAPVERFKIQRIRNSAYLTNNLTPGGTWANMDSDLLVRANANSSNGYAEFTTTNAASFIDDPVTSGDQPAIISGVKYIYRIAVKDVANDTYSPWPAQSQFLATGYTRDQLAPTNPSNVVATAVSGHEVNVTWTQSSDGTEGSGVGGYLIYRKHGVSSEADGWELVGESIVINPGTYNPSWNDNETNRQITSTLFKTGVSSPVNDFTFYNYRVVAFDNATDERKPDGTPDKNISPLIPDAPYATVNLGFVQTPDVTPPTLPNGFTVGRDGIDDPYAETPMQQVKVYWNANFTITDNNPGALAAKPFRIYEYGPTASLQSPDQASFRVLPDNEYSAKEGETNSYIVPRRDDISYYYYFVEVFDGAGNTAKTTTSYVKTGNSKAPGPVTSARMDTISNFVSPDLGHKAVLSFNGGFTKNCGVDGVNADCVTEYEVYVSNTNDNTACNNLSPDECWIFRNNHTSYTVENTITNTADLRTVPYSLTLTGLNDASSYYAMIRAKSNSADTQIQYSVFAPATVGITPDITAPSVPNNDLAVKVKDTHPNDTTLRNIISWVKLPQANVLRPKLSYETDSCKTVVVNGAEYCDDFGKYEIHREMWNPNTNTIVNTMVVASITDITDNLYTDNIAIDLKDFSFKYFVRIYDNAGTNFKNPQGSVVRAVDNQTIDYYSRDSIIPGKAIPSVLGNVTVSDVGVTSAVVHWTTDQDTDSLVQYRPMKLASDGADWSNAGNWVTNDINNDFTTVGQVDRISTHNVKLFGMTPKTRYEYKLVSRNYLDNPATYDTGKLAAVITSGFDIAYQAAKLDVTTASAQLYWTTNMPSNSNMVEFRESNGTQSGAVAETPVKSEKITDAMKNCSANTTSPLCTHSVTVSPLKKNTEYTINITSVSLDNYSASSGLKKFVTANSDSKQFTIAPSASNVAERNITSTSAQIIFQTSEETTATLYYDTKSGAPTYDPKDYKMTSTDAVKSTTHQILVDGLEPGKKYFYVVRVDNGLLAYTSPEASFTAVLKPKISNLHVADVTPYSFKLDWETNIDTETLINLGTSANYGEKRGKPGLVKTHELLVDGLLDNQEYHYQILAKDETGEEVASADAAVRTPMDTEGPKISAVKIDVLPMGESDTTSSVIISWITNKPATTLVEYDEGVIGGNYSMRSVEDTTLNNSHTVIVKGLSPASSYHYRLVSADKRNNKTVSDDFTFVTPSKEKSILQLILKSLEETFAWTRNLNQFFGNIGKRITGK